MIKFPLIIERTVSVKILSIKVIEGNVELIHELLEEIKEWAFYKAKDFGDHAGFLTDKFDEGDSLLDFDDPFVIEVCYT